MKRELLILVGILVLTFAFINIYIGLKNYANSNIITKLEGHIYYTKRIDGVLNLYKSDANLKNEELIYSHKGKGKDNYGGYNDNIIDYFYDVKSGDIKFVAMNTGDWSLFSIKKGDKSPTLVKKIDLNNSNKLTMIDTDYVKSDVQGITVKQKQGSIYIDKDGKENCLVKFHGLYDGKFTGYSVIGLSPDAKYLIYHSMGHLTAFGTIIEGAIKGSTGGTYIMNIETGKSTKFKDAYKIQWIMD